MPTVFVFLSECNFGWGEIGDKKGEVSVEAAEMQ